MGESSKRRSRGRKGRGTTVTVGGTSQSSFASAMGETARRGRRSKGNSPDEQAPRTDRAARAGYNRQSGSLPANRQDEQ